MNQDLTLETKVDSMKLAENGTVNSSIESQPTKTAKQLEKEAKKLEKDQKFKEKQEKLAAAAAAAKTKPSTSNNDKPIVEKDEKKQEPASIKYTINTPSGDKKDTTCPLPDAYNPLYVEACWYEWWQKMGFFKPECAQKYFPNAHEKFVIAMPPPNVTGTLHLGHALMSSVEDTLTRWHRMSGYITLFNPGVDHAGIATQVVVEKKLAREKKLSRHDVGREEFVKEIWKWKEEKGDTIVHQLRKMGTSCDWDRLCFTMDENSSRAVEEAFIQLHERGLIYRSKRLVNWSCQLNSAISDIEVEKTPLKGRTLLSIPGYKEKIEFGTLTYFAYKIKDSDEKIVVATTRLETMLGDTAIAVNPKDDRFKHLVGKQVEHPFVKERLMRIVSDDMVDMSFGTGAVKITPAHDAYDFECGKRHNLEFVTCIDDKGFIRLKEDLKFNGMKRFDARKAICAELKQLGLFVDIKDTETVLPICSRSKDVIEPMLKSQWYVNCKTMSGRAVQAVKEKRLEIIPSQFEQTWFKWLEDCHDWCISRQLWWGHRIPAYLILNKLDELDDSSNDCWISARSEEEAREKVHVKYPNLKKDEIRLRQDEDVLDTWFSSGLFPFSMLKWPQTNVDFESYYPNSLLETGHDILFFWVARMVMLGEELCGKLPFNKIYLHAIIRDAHGRKMSKSLGNMIDPLDVIYGCTLNDLHEQLLKYNLDEKEIDKAKKGQREDYPQGIPECGTDALRFALLAYTSQGRDINLDVLRVQGYRFFCNKLWNATKFAMMNGLGAEFKPCERLIDLNGSSNGLGSYLSLMDKWILNRLNETIEQCDRAFKSYEFTQATTACYNFWLYDLCDYYIEYLKPNFYLETQDMHKQECSREILYTCMDVALRLIHPFMPFISEELYQRLPRRQPELDAPSICVTPYPKPSDFSLFKNDQLDSDFGIVKEAISKLRSLRADYQLTPKIKTTVFVQSIDSNLEKTLVDFKDVLEIMTNSAQVVFINENEASVNLNGCAFATLSDKCKLFILLKGIIDITKEIEKLAAKKDKINQQIANLNKDMSKKDYGDKVPEQVRLKNSEKLCQLENEVKLIDEGVLRFNQMLKSS